MRSSISSRLSDVVSALLVNASESDRAFVAQHVCAYPTPLLERLVAAQCRIRPLARRERYCDASPALQRLGIDVDGWPVPPAGLFGDVLQGLHDKRVSCKSATFIGVPRDRQTEADRVRHR